MDALQRHKSRLLSLLNELFDALGEELQRETIARERKTHKAIPHRVASTEALFFR